MRATIYATRAEAEKAITAIDAARAPDGTEERVRYVRGREVSRERVPAKPWAEPIELDDGRFALNEPARLLCRDEPGSYLPYALQVAGFFDALRDDHPYFWVG